MQRIGHIPQAIYVVVCLASKPFCQFIRVILMACQIGSGHSHTADAAAVILNGAVTIHYISVIIQSVVREEAVI